MHWCCVPCLNKLPSSLGRTVPNNCDPGPIKCILYAYGSNNIKMLEHMGGLLIITCLSTSKILAELLTRTCSQTGSELKKGCGFLKWGRGTVQASGVRCTLVKGRTGKHYGSEIIGILPWLMSDESPGRGVARKGAFRSLRKRVLLRIVKPYDTINKKDIAVNNRTQICTCNQLCMLLIEANWTNHEYPPLYMK